MPEPTPKINSKVAKAAQSREGGQIDESCEKERKERTRYKEGVLESPHVL